MQYQTVLAVQMSVCRHQHCAERQRFHLAAGIGFIFQHENVGKTFAHKRHHRWVICCHPIGKCRQAGVRSRKCAAVFNVQRHAAGWRVARRAVDDRCIGCLNCVEFKTKRRFKRVFPALPDPDRLPQARRVIQLIFRQPHGEAIIVVEPGLLILQRQQRSLDARQLTRGVTDGIDRNFALRFQFIQTFFRVGEFFFGLQQCFLRFCALGLHAI